MVQSTADYDSLTLMYFFTCRYMKKLPEVARHSVLRIAKCMVENGHVARHVHIDERMRNLMSIFQ